LTRPERESYAYKVKQRNRDRLEWVHEELAAATDALKLDHRGELTIRIPILQGMFGDPSISVTKYRPQDAQN